MILTGELEKNNRECGRCFVSVSIEISLVLPRKEAENPIKVELFAHARGLVDVYKYLFDVTVEFRSAVSL